MRQPELDLVKWVALTLVTLGHTRFVWPELGWLAQPGRFAFVSLCAVMAAHALRQGEPCRSTCLLVHEARRTARLQPMTPPDDLYPCRLESADVGVLGLLREHATGGKIRFNARGEVAD